MFKIRRRTSSRGSWASFQLNDLGGEAEIVIYSDTINKYEAHLNERNLILVDVEVKNETNQGFRIIGRRIRSSKNSVKKMLEIQNGVLLMVP